MNLWKKIVASAHLVTLVMLGGSCLLAGETGVPCELYAYLDAAWIPADAAETLRKAEVLSDLRFCTESGQKVFELDLTEMDSDQNIKLDSVQHLTCLRALRCPGRNTKALVLPPKLPENLEELDFSASRLYRYPLEMIEEPFLHSKNLQKLKLSNCDFLLEAERALFISPTVETLDLSGNDLSEFFQRERGTVGNPRVKGLLVVDQEERRAVASSFSELREKYGSGYLERISEPLGLRKLILCRCQLGDVLSLAGLPGTLEEIDLRETKRPKAAILDELIKSLPKLRELNVAWGDVEGLFTHDWSAQGRAFMAQNVKQLKLFASSMPAPEDRARMWALVGELQSLEELDLGVCDLTAFPASLPTSLKRLVLQTNHFVRVGAEAWAALFAQLPNLEELDLAVCGLTALPVGLPVSLKRLMLGWNHFAQVDAQAWMACFAGLPHLEELDLCRCRLFELPVGLPGSLKRLVLQANNFAWVSAEAWAALFAQLPNLEELDLSCYCRFKLSAELPASLKKLVLAYNDFAQVGALAWRGLFARLSNLEELDLSGCSITELPVGLPASLKKLVLAYNDFAQVGALAWMEWFVGLQPLEELVIEGLRYRQPGGLHT